MSLLGASEAYVAMPLEALGNRYIVPQFLQWNFSSTTQYDGYIQIVTTDVQLVTDITVSTSVGTSLGPAGTYQLALAASTAWLITTQQSVLSLSGTELTGSAPFAVTAGHQCTQVPTGCSYCNPLIEQLPPVNSWGKAFFITPFLQNNLGLGNQSCAFDPKFNVRGDVVIVVAAQSGTRLSYNGQPFGPANGLVAAEVYSFPLPAPNAVYLTSNRPIQVLQLMEGWDARRSSVGDPSMTDPNEVLAVTVYGMNPGFPDGYSKPAGMAVADLLAQPRCPPSGLPVGGVSSTNIIGYSNCSSTSYAEGATCLATCSTGTSGGKATCTSNPDVGGIWVASDCLL
eukprot:gene2587-2889_t